MIDEFLWKNKTIRNYLHQFKEEEVNRIVRSTLLLGVQYLKEKSPGLYGMTA